MNPDLIRRYGPWVLGAGVVVLVISYFRKSSSNSPAAAAPSKPAFSSQQELQDFGVFQSLTQAQQGADLGLFSDVLGLMTGGGGATSGAGNPYGGGTAGGTAGGSGGTPGQFAGPGVNSTPSPSGSVSSSQLASQGITPQNSATTTNAGGMPITVTNEPGYGGTITVQPGQSLAAAAYQAAQGQTSDETSNPATWQAPPGYPGTGQQYATALSGALGNIP